MGLRKRIGIAYLLLLLELRPLALRQDEPDTNEGGDEAPGAESQLNVISVTIAESGMELVSTALRRECGRFGVS